MLEFLFLVKWRLSSLHGWFISEFIIRVIFDLVTDLLYGLLDLFLALLRKM